MVDIGGGPVGDHIILVSSINISHNAAEADDNRLVHSSSSGDSVVPSPICARGSSINGNMHPTNSAMNLFWFSTQSKNELIADLVIWNLSSIALICRKSTLLFLCSRNFGGQSFSVPHDFRHWLKVSCIDKSRMNTFSVIM